MADNTNTSSGKPNEKAKWLLASGLAISFGVVLVMQYGGHSYGSQPPVTSERPLAAARPANIPGAQGATEPMPARRWPNIGIDDILLHNPFSLEAQNRSGTDNMESDADRSADSGHDPSGAPVPVGRGALDPALAALLRDEVQVVIQSERGASAVVGTHVVHTGDTIDGWRVVDINDAGVFVEAADDN